MQKVYLGSINPVKLRAAQNILEPLGFTVEGVNSASGVSNQPLNDDETMRGALNRALSLPEGHFRIGLEAGIELHFDQMFLVNWGALIDPDNRIYWAGGTRIPLPDQIKSAILNNHVELSVAMNIFFNEKNINHREGAIGYFTDCFVRRSDIFEHIVKLLIGQYFNQKKKEER
jgi:non-canonical (house-cleaning) NTP pyrophosphatase